MGDGLALNVHDGDILYTLWETTQLPAQWVSYINRAKAVVVSSQFNREVFQRSGVKRPIYILPLGVDHTKFCVSQAFPKGKIFATAGRNLHGRERKGIDNVILGFLKAFPTESDVVLRIKEHADCFDYRLSDSRLQWIKMYLKEPEYIRFYQEALCFVSAATGEGWGLHQHEAMMCGKPLISVKWGGVDMFFGGDPHGYVLPHKLQTVKNYYADGGQWATTTIEDIATAFRAVYENPLDYFLRGLKARVDVERFSLDAFHTNAAKLMEHLT
jgi:glycosyltransferase involved in cell wall biosynthesis